MGVMDVAIKRIGVVGSGIMGAGVAEVAAAAGFEVVLRSRTRDGADAMLAGLDASLARQVKKGRTDESVAAELRARVTAVTALDELAACDLVLESIVEDLATKQELFRELDRVCTPSAILAHASNQAASSSGCLPCRSSPILWSSPMSDPPYAADPIMLMNAADQR